jgi:hypothetical protein
MNDEHRSEGIGPESPELMLEAATTAHRERDPVTGRILPSPAWWDLSAAERQVLFDRQLESRSLERAAGTLNLSSTAHAVLARVRRVPQLGG